MSGLSVVAALLTKPILLKRLFAQDEFSKSRSFKCSRLLLSIKDFAVATATILLTIPLFSIFVKIFLNLFV